MLSASDGAFCILHAQSIETWEAKWRDCLANSDFPTHYTAPEFFLEPALRGQKPFAILSLAGDRVTAVLTGIHDGSRVQSGLSVRPQIAFSQHVDRSLAIRNLLAGLIQELRSAKVIDLFLWPDLDRAVDPRFHQKQYEGVVLLDLTLGSAALFRQFSSNKKTNIKKAIKYAVSVDVAQSRSDISDYYQVYADWSRRKALPVTGEEQLQDMFALTGNRRLFLARYEGQVVAGVVVRFFPSGVVEYAANSSLENTLHLRPNDLLHWRAIEWACAEGMTKYSLGGAHLFLRKFGGQLVPTYRYRLDLSVFRRYAMADWMAETVREVQPFIPPQMVSFGRSLRSKLKRYGAPAIVERLRELSARP